MTRSVFVLVVVLALVLAGCSGLVPGGDGTPTETVSPAAVPTDQPTPTPVPRLAPGLSGKGVTDPFTLKQAHASVLENTSFTLRREEIVRFTNGTPYSRIVSNVKLAANETRYDAAFHSSGGSSRGPRLTREWWSNGERVLKRQTSNGSTSYSVPRGPNGGAASPRKSDVRSLGINPVMDDRIYTLFGAVETRFVGETTRNGTTLYEVAATKVTRRAEFTTLGVNRSRNVSFRTLVTPRGLVREYRIDYTAMLTGRSVPASLAGKTVHVHRAVRYTDLGNTTIERPSWYDEAVANVSTAAPTTAG